MATRGLSHGFSHPRLTTNPNPEAILVFGGVFSGHSVNLEALFFSGRPTDLQFYSE